MPATDSLLGVAEVDAAVARLEPRSERVALPVLVGTYVDAGVLAFVSAPRHQVIFGRRGTGKSHVLRVIGANTQQLADSTHLYLPLDQLGSASIVFDPTQPLQLRCVNLFRDLLASINNHLLDLATDPQRPERIAAIEAVAKFQDALYAQTVAVERRSVTVSETQTEETRSAIKAEASLKAIGVGAEASDGSSETTTLSESFDEMVRETLVFSSVVGPLDEALASLGIDHFYLLLDEWASVPREVQPYLAEFLKRTLLHMGRVTLKIAALEYRSVFFIPRPQNQRIGFELGPDIPANVDLDDYFVYDKNPEQITTLFEDVLFRHLQSELASGFLEARGVVQSDQLRRALFTERGTFVELVRAGEGVARDFLGIFASSYLRSVRERNQKITLNSVEEAAREWYETDKRSALTPGHDRALRQIVDEVIAKKQSKSFLVDQTESGHSMIRELFDLRVVHLMRKGYSDKENPGKRYNIFAVDYGTYVDLKRTKAQIAFDMPEIDAPDAERIVPFDDHRSIRRIVLNPSSLWSQPEA